MPKIPPRHVQEIENGLTIKIETVSKERLALNLFDIDRIDPLIGIVMGGKLDLSKAIKVDPDRLDETAVAFSCDLLTAACICDTIRTHDKAVKDYPTRVYIFRRSAWSKVAGQGHLSIVVDNKCVLNPKIFSSVPAANDAEPLKAKKMF